MALWIFRGGGTEVAQAQASVPNVFTEGDLKEAEAIDATFEALVDHTNPGLANAAAAGLVQF